MGGRANCLLKYYFKDGKSFAMTGEGRHYDYLAPFPRSMCLYA
jgi:hypothetical protein